MTAITLTATVLKTYVSPVGEKDGVKYGGDHRLQVMAETTLRNGETRVQLIELRVDDPTPYKDLAGSVMSLPVSLYVSKGQVAFSLIQ
jgi:hypothetical protein